MATRGRFIVLEGGEGSGKSTQAQLLARSLGAELTREPGGTPVSEEIRSLLLGVRAEPVEARAELLLMAAARAQHVARRIEPALAAGRDVVSDRFSGSTLAYQGYGRGLALDEVIAVDRVATAGLEPDLVVVIDLPVDVARTRRDEATDRIEAAGREFHERVRAGFLALAAANPSRWVVIDGMPGVEEVFERVAASVRERLGAR